MISSIFTLSQGTFACVRTPFTGFYARTSFCFATILASTDTQNRTSFGLGSTIGLCTSRFIFSLTEGLAQFSFIGLVVGVSNLFESFNEGCLVPIWIIKHFIIIIVVLTVISK